MTAEITSYDILAIASYACIVYVLNTILSTCVVAIAIYTKSSYVATLGDHQMISAYS